MKTFLAFVRKEFYHILRDKRSLFILLGMPIAQVLLFGYAITMELREVGFVVLDNSKDSESKELIQRFQASGHFYLVDNLEYEEEIHQSFQAGTIKLAMVIPANFSGNFGEGKATLQLIADGTEPNTATTLVNYAQAIIRQFQLDKGKVDELPFGIEMNTRMVYNPALRSVYMFVPGVITVLLMLVSAMMTSLTIAREKELGTMELLLVSPIHPLMIIIGKVVPYILIGLLDASLILAIGILVFGVPVLGSWLLLFTVVVLFILTSLSLGILISTRVDTQQTALMGSLVALMMPSVLLSGFIFPIESMPLPLQVIAQVIPAKWFIVILKDVMLKGVGLQVIGWETLVLAGMAVFFIIVSWRNFKIRLG